jgi:sporulation protein YlmC with PRC-barrel domain
MDVREAQGRKVVSIDDAEALGKVEAFIVDPQQRRISALTLAKAKDDARFLSWTDLNAFGADAVTVASAELLRPAADDSEERSASKALQLIGKLVLDASGTALGTVQNMDFDPESGQVLAFDLGDSGKIVSDRLLGIGSYAVVVADTPEG